MRTLLPSFANALMKHCLRDVAASFCLCRLHASFVNVCCEGFHKMQGLHYPCVHEVTMRENIQAGCLWQGAWRAPAQQAY